MSRAGFSRAVLTAALLLGAAIPAASRELRTVDGGLVTLQFHVAPTDLSPGRAAQPSAVRAGVAWTLRDGAGSEYSGVLAGSGGIREELPLLLQNPADGEIHIIFSAPHDGSRDLFLRTWLGQAWSEATWLAGAPDADDEQPRAVFTAAGEIVLAWVQRQPAGDHVLFQYGEMDAQGMQVLKAHLDMGRPSLYTLPVDGNVQLEAGIADLRLDATGDRVVLFLADPDAEDVGVLRLDLRAMRQIIGGGSFAPVPVNFLQLAMGNGPGGVGDRMAEAGDLLATWRVELLEGEGYYWFDEDTMSGLGFRGGAVRGGLVTMRLPEEEIVAHALMVARLRQAIGRLEADLAPLLARRNAQEQRRPR